MLIEKKTLAFDSFDTLSTGPDVTILLNTQFNGQKRLVKIDVGRKQSHIFSPFKAIANLKC